MINRRVGIVGAGFVGASTAYNLSILGICREIILYDIVEEIAIGKALDIGQSNIYSPKKTIISVAKEPKELKECDIVVITAGVPRKEGMTRADLLNINAKIVQEVVTNIVKYSPNAVIISVSNPLDVMTYLAYKVSKWDRKRVIGMAGALDSLRMKYQIAKRVDFEPNQIEAMVIGEHGKNMIPYPKLSSIAGIPLEKFLKEEEIKEIIEKTKEGGAEIVQYLKTSAYYAPATAITKMVQAILDDSNLLVTASVILEGEYGYKDVSIGVPIILNSSGVKEIIELEFDSETQKEFENAVKSIKNNIEILNL